MRLITRKKIWRAFPELDEFDDEACQRYINRAWHILETFRGWMLVFVTITISLIAWFAIYMLIHRLLLRYSPGWMHTPGYPIADLIGLVFTLGCFLIPWIAYFCIRDFWMSLQIRKLLEGARCPSCKYSLLGLLAYTKGKDRCVRCPECAQELTFSDEGMTEADINPELLKES